tara:strand:- start:1353 stop:1703 length:351 start_codon:yes stop_codon:yes gene_type:complete
MAATTTVQNILDAAWQILKDPSGALFYPAADMYRWVNEGVEQIRQARPECQITSAGALITITPVTALVDVISIDDRHYTAILEWVLYRAFGADAEDAGDLKQAAAHQAAFDRALGR